MFFHTFHPFPLIIDFGFVAVHWYGFLISLSVVVCFFIGKRLFRRYKLPGQLFFDLVFHLLIFGFIGARLWHILSEFSYYSSHLLDIFKIWQGGLAIHGALVGGVITLYFFVQKLNLQSEQSSRAETIQQYNNITKKQGGNNTAAQKFFPRKFIFFLFLDIFAPLIVLGQAIGRLGNYFNQELYGRPVEWGIPIDLANRLSGYENYKYFHPIFLYESLWCLIIFFFLLWLHSLRLKGYACGKGIAKLLYCYIVKIAKIEGNVFSLYLILYSLGRFFIGFLRIDPQAAWLNLRLDQWMSVILFMVGIILFIRRSYHHQLKNKSPQKS